MQIQREVARLVQLEKLIGAKASRSIALLKERRSAITTAAVTGKINLLNDGRYWDFPHIPS
jgi:type I restriction enzyme S subunit